MPIIWRWDQGRLQYFKFSNIKLIASCLSELDGLELQHRGSDVLRSQLEGKTGLPFLPKHYTVWRNYARVFACTLLAARISGRLAVTDLCRKISGKRDVTFETDEYLSYIVPKFYEPFLAFEDYNASSERVFPFCAVLKYLVAQCRTSGEAQITLNDVFSLIIGNDCQGIELFCPT